MAGKKEKTLEEAFTQLDMMLEKLADKDVPLEESFEIYEEGTKLLRYCSEKLDTVEKKMLQLNEDGTCSEF